jgi:hypothetical protein
VDGVHTGTRDDPLSSNGRGNVHTVVMVEERVGDKAEDCRGGPDSKTRVAALVIIGETSMILAWADAKDVEVLSMHALSLLQ